MSTNIDIPTPTQSHKTIYYKQLSLHERQAIFRWHHQEKKSIRTIAKLLNRSPSTISREIRRHTSTFYLPCYYPKIADHAYRHMTRKRGKRMRLKNKENQIIVENRLKDGWSPEIIAGRMKSQTPANSLCHEAIYQFIYKERSDLVKYLPRQHAKRRKKVPYRKRPVESVYGKIPISQRPSVVGDRHEYGHWESDSVVDRSHTGINVVVERKTRMVHITKLHDATSESTANALMKQLGKHPSSFVKSITYDNGSENAKHLLVNRSRGCTSYFCQPYHSWEKGQVENTNEKIRRFIPNKTDLSTISQSQLNEIEAKLNNRPKKCLSYQTPNEAYLAWRINESNSRSPA